MPKLSREAAKEAIKTLLRFIGDDPEREGLLQTPDRVIDSYSEIFAGYTQNAEDILEKRFYDVGNVNNFVLLKSISFTSFCEHHLLPITGHVDIAYMPRDCVVGISKLVRLVNIFARRLQIQEKMTIQIAENLQKYLNPTGVAVRVSASHGCMTARGVLQSNSMMDTTHYIGIFNEQRYRKEFLDMIKS